LNKGNEQKIKGEKSNFLAGLAMTAQICNQALYIHHASLKSQLSWQRIIKCTPAKIYWPCIFHFKI